MSDIPPISASAPGLAPTAGAGASASDPALADAFAQGVAQYMGLMLMSAGSDIQEACNDTTSTPDATT